MVVSTLGENVVRRINSRCSRASRVPSKVGLARVLQSAGGCDLRGIKIRMKKILTHRALVLAGEPDGLRCVEERLHHTHTGTHTAVPLVKNGGGLVSTIHFLGGKSAHHASAH
jgi:hypothetical protein